MRKLKQNLKKMQEFRNDAKLKQSSKKMQEFRIVAKIEAELYKRCKELSKTLKKMLNHKKTKMEANPKKMRQEKLANLNKAHLNQLPVKATVSNHLLSLHKQHHLLFFIYHSTTKLLPFTIH